MAQSESINFPAVAIGGSAGGLDALEQLFDSLSPDIGAAYLVVQHLKADQPSQLAEILARHTNMPVLVAKEGAKLEPNHVYVVPPAADVLIEGRCLRLVEPDATKHMPTSIDRTMRSLADANGALSVGVLLSGMGSDGSLGLRAIKAAGGLVIAQDPATAQFDSMPRAAIATDAVDCALAPSEIGKSLRSYLLRQNGHPPVYEEDQLEPILELVRYAKRNDFRGYKRPMLSRRVARRVTLAGLDSLNEYLDYLKEKPDEIEQLHRDLLISVTDFFRNPEAYKVLKSKILPGLVARANKDTPIRAWIPACATGEEAYTVAMLLADATRSSQHEVGVNLFASDIDERALETARLGIYPENISVDVPAAHLTRYFSKTDQHYQITGELRQSIVFASQDLLRDPPYSHLDLISCRNLLIYLSPDVQKYVLALFHFALRDGGYLFLGNAETIGQADDLFEPVDARHRIYRRIAGAVRDQRHFPFAHRGSRRPMAPADPPITRSRGSDADRIAQQLLLREYVPAAVLINRKSEIICAYGPTHIYLALPTGASNLDLMEMVNEDLRNKLRAVVHQAIRENRKRQVVALRDQPDTLPRSVRINVRPLTRPASAQGLLLVTFEENAVLSSVPLADNEAANDEHRMAEELRVAREELQGTIQSLEGSNEDLQGSNEEIMSINEELQSTNEELETSKEELQSLNEELSTVNNELHSKISELERLNDDLANLFAGTRVATLFLDRGLRIMRYTPTIQDVFNLLHSDVGRPLHDIKFKFEDSHLLSDAAEVLNHLVQREREVQGENGRWYLRRILPYRTLNDVIDGVVITFTDVTELEEATTKAQASEEQLRLLADALPALIAYVNTDCKFEFVNAAYRDWFDVEHEDALLGTTLRDLFGDAHFQNIKGHCETAIAGKRVTYEDALTHKRLGERAVYVSHVPIIGKKNGKKNGKDSGPAGFYLLATDITDRKQKENIILDRQAEAAHANRIASMSELAATIAHQLNQPLGSISNYAGALKNMLDKDDEASEIAKKLAVQARSAADIINEMRELIGRRTFDQENVDINALVQRVLALTEGRTAAVGAQIELSLSSNVPAIFGSPIQLEQMLVNLVVNALEAMEDVSERVLSIMTEYDSKQKSILLTVSDTGEGIPIDKINQIFNTFYTSKKEGMGMGLAICRGIVEDYGGKIWAESGEQGGASFSVRLPVDEALLD